jgi:hypothetical protein
MIKEKLDFSIMDSRQVRDVLSIFYEGFFEEFSRHGKDVNFKIECSYLADLVRPGTRYFFGTLKNVDEFYFVPWEEENMEVSDLKIIESLKLDILGAEFLYDKVKIYSNCCHSYSGGNLYLSAAGIKVYDETFERLDYNSLHDLADKYWDTVNRY